MYFFKFLFKKKIIVIESYKCIHVLVKCSHLTFSFYFYLFYSILGLRKCREQWPEEAVGYERFYNIFLDLVLLVLPLGILCVAYILITRTLYMGIKDEKALIFGNKNNNGIGGSNGGAGDVKIYTRVEAETKTPTVFNLNMSFRYHTRKSMTSAVTGSGIVGGDTLQIVETSTNNGRDTKYFTSYNNGTNVDIENKYSAMGSISATAVGQMCGRKGVCYNAAAAAAVASTATANNQQETEISLREMKEQSNNLERQSMLRQNCSGKYTYLLMIFSVF